MSLPEAYHQDNTMVLYHGDCWDVLPLMEENSVDAVVTDPPYHLTTGKKGGQGFMGKAWDGGNVAHDPETWRRVLRVAKPGAYLLAFGGTRTFHRLACAIEDAGWELRDTLMWLYGCLSEDTEILVDGRWEPYHKAIAGKRAFCYNMEDGTFQWMPIEELLVYEYDDTAYHISSERTDQIVSRNHRCIVDRGNGWEFVPAEEAARQPAIRVPVLEDLQGLLEAFPYDRPVPSCPQEDLLSRVRGRGYAGTKSEETDGGAQDDPSGLSSVRQGNMEAECLAAQECAGVLQPVLSRQGACSAPPSFLWQHEGPQAERPSLRCRQSCVEGRGNLLQEAWQLSGSQVRSLPSRVLAHGSEGRVRDGAPSDGCPGARSLSAPLRGGSPQEPSALGESANQSPTVLQQRPPQAVRGDRFTSANLVSVEPIPYTGKVWCVRVPTGAFVARRNGKVFVTGNSGFPKSLDVSKAIDKAAGMETIVGEKPDRWTGKGNTLNFSTDRPQAMCKITTPATDAAARWEGFGTALKPAWEPIIVARKPLVGTVAANVLAYGTGALNIDGCRIEGPAWTRPTTQDIRGGGYGSSQGKNVPAPRSSEGGRWPANVALTHSAGCQLLGTRTVKSDCYYPAARGQGHLVEGHKGQEGLEERKVGTETVEAWDCVEDCPVKMLDEQSGTLQSGQVGPGGLVRHADKFRNTYDTFKGQAPEAAPIYGDQGGASRFFYTGKATQAERGESNTHATVKPLDLMRWLCRLVTPPGGLILDPFAGSGTTGRAAALEGFRSVLIELAEEHCQIIAGRFPQGALGI